MAKRSRITATFGASELFGRAVVSLEPEEMRRLALTSHKEIQCPFKTNAASCIKKSGVCSIAVFEQASEDQVTVKGLPVSLCPNRFLERDMVYKWVGQTLLGTSEPKVIAELPFLIASKEESGPKQDKVGQIDSVLVSPQSGELKWCALEMQAVYFSGSNMGGDLAKFREWTGTGFPFPTGRRHPDFRSSGPKRLMPQLQIKVPTLRRWGKKMAVVVDKRFWSSFRPMRKVAHLSNADIVWFVVDYDPPEAGAYKLRSSETVFTTLEDAVEGLTGGDPVTLEQFEATIVGKLGRLGAR